MVDWERNGLWIILNLSALIRQRRVVVWRSIQGSHKCGTLYDVWRPDDKATSIPLHVPYTNGLVSRAGDNLEPRGY